jgi:hypothetical protein
MIKLKHLIEEWIDTNVWYHGSPSGDLRGGTSGLHLGTYNAAKEALEARIGIPSNGEWDGTREYGKTLLCGQATLKKRHIFPTGFNCDVPETDFYPTKSPGSASYLTLTMKPFIKQYKIVCSMTNSPQTPYSDSKANGYMKGLLKKGIKLHRGFYYKNDGEDFGSISAVVPDGSCVKEV